MDDQVVSVRLPRRDLETIDRKVKGGEFVNRSDFVRHAVRVALEGEEDGLPRLGISVGAETPQPAPRRTPRGLKR